MSDQIPVGSPPAPPGRHAAPGGWYADPLDNERERYWDGWQWSRQTRESERADKSAPRTIRSRSTDSQTTDTSTTDVPSTHARAGGSADAVGAPAGRGPGTMAGWWQRAGAVVIDWLLLTVVGMIVLSPVYSTIGDRALPIITTYLDDARGGVATPLQPEALVTQQESFIISVITIALALAYHVLLVRWRSATLGKLALGLRIVTLVPENSDAADAGQVRHGVTWRAAVIRALVWVIPGQSACLWPLRLVDVMLPLRNPRRQALHDVVAATQVVRTR